MKMKNYDGVYFLSNPGELQALMREIEDKAYAQMGQGTGEQAMLPRLQVLEDKLRQQEEYVMKVVSAIAKEFTVLRDRIDEELAEQEKRLFLIQKDAYQRTIAQQNTQEEWRQEMETRCQHITELVGSLETAICSQSSLALWFRQLWSVK